MRRKSMLGLVFALLLWCTALAGCALVMSVVQDDIVDARGRPWPEVADGNGSGLGVLDVVNEPLGIAHWSLRGHPLCAVGHLVETCRALGWRIL